MAQESLERYYEILRYQEKEAKLKLMEEEIRRIVIENGLKKP